MARRVMVALLWHMHQPSYRDTVRGVSLLPMAFLHAIKDYYEMPRVAEKHPRARLTFNLVPCLLDQLPLPGTGEVAGCAFLKVLLSPAGELDEAERGNLLTLLFMADEKHQVMPLPRYYELFEKKERLRGRASPGLVFDDQEFLDLAVLFLLAWTGTVIREEEPFVQELLRRGSRFTQEEKERLTELLVRKTGAVPSIYRAGQEQGRWEVSSSPYYHPILPLLLDLSSAREMEKDLPLPVVTARFGDDAALQVDRGLARMAEAMGRPCAGMWPPEGSLSPAALGLLASRGVRWTASDEEVLANSLGEPLTGEARSGLYRPWTWEAPGGKSIAVFFRDRGLSDLIGFTYQRWEAQAAADDFVARVQAIRDSLPREDGVIPVILDGENAWEHYPRNGRTFLDHLYRGLAEAPGVEMVTFGEALERCAPAPLSRLTAGSWIGGRLSTWVGHPEKNAAWELLGQTREHLAARAAAAGDKPSPAAREAALEEMLSAEGSDWMWWMGDDHWSSISDRFDDLFRLHLQNVHRHLGDAPPSRLFTPIKRTTRVGHLSSPVGHLAPVLDGRMTDFFEWRSAGTYDLLYEQGAMHAAGGILHSLFYGFDESNLYLRLDSDAPLRERLQGLSLAIDVVAPAARAITFSSGEGDGPMRPDPAAAAAGVRAAVENVAEMALPLSYLGVSPGGEILLAFEVRRGAEPLERAPTFSLVKLPVPSDYLLESWVV